MEKIEEIIEILKAHDVPNYSQIAEEIDRAVSNSHHKCDVCGEPTVSSEWYCANCETYGYY